jgi:dUTPase-like protein
MDRLAKIFESKAKSSSTFRTVQYELGMVHLDAIEHADWKTREGCIELHKGIHWINLELSEFLGASPSERPEELADILHFLVEFALLLGFDANLLAEDTRFTDRLELMLEASKNDAFVFPDEETNARFMILANLQVAEMLKNKPWKQTLKTEMNEAELKQRVRGMFYWFGATARTNGLDAETLFQQFMRKEQINYKRIASGV